MRNWIKKHDALVFALAITVPAPVILAAGLMFGAVGLYGSLALALWATVKLTDVIG